MKSEFWVQALLRRTQSEGGFASVLRRGDADAGIVLIIFRERKQLTLFSPERNFEGERVWHPEFIDNQASLDSKVNKRVDYDPDLWILEIESTLSPERLIGEPIAGLTAEPDPAEAAAQALFRGR
ncbi:hypothetical protein DES40_2559 [Litorimonas taeanensis]|uniref:DUF1491 family protein n=1 Tax=Litorimonas taeanensis TaxID=568099 RepID=A0A420WFI1_9PROT|nr:DUF1491 family protein [Litorimonas taeanensis]RKQ69750.1 hypothetical protein DES40_2559 [Litorimonas taeanensis]